MIILYDKQEQEFNKLGLGILSDAISCAVVEELNGAFELEMEYPVSGQHYKDITQKRIILAKPNMYNQPQPFRVYDISRPLGGIVTVKAEHISYDLSGYTIGAFNVSVTVVYIDPNAIPYSINWFLDNAGGSAIIPVQGGCYIVKTAGEFFDRVYSWDDISYFESSALELVLKKLQDNSVITNPFVFDADSQMLIKSKATSMKVKSPYNARSLLAGSDGSIHDIYGGEFSFDRFKVDLLTRRGLNRGVSIRYGKNMTELEQQTSSQNVYTGVFPFYFASYSETKVNTELHHWFVYVVAGKTPETVGWLSLKDDGSALYDPIVYVEGQDTIPVQIRTAGDYYNQVFVYRKTTAITSYIVNGSTPLGSGWLADVDGGVAIIPAKKTRYLIKTEGEFLDKVYIWDGNTYLAYTNGGFFYIPDPIPAPSVPGSTTETIEKEDYLDLITGDTSYIRGGVDPFTALWLSEKVDGTALIPNENKIYIVKTEGEYFDHKYVWNSTSYIPFVGSSIVYIDQNASPQRILTLDLSASFTEKPTVGMLRLRALEYISNNKLNEIKESISVSFIKLSDSPEYQRYAGLERVELGDTIKIIHEALGIESELNVISTEYNVITEKYNEILLGKRSESISDTAITKNDSVSSMSNDARYTDISTVYKMIAQTITAEYILATNASLTNAQIEVLTVAKIACPGIIEASSLSIDKIVARLLTAENAEIKNVLQAGEVIVKGTIYAKVGSIGGILIKENSIESENGSFRITKEGQIYAKSVQIDGKFVGDVDARSLKVKDDVNPQNAMIEINDAKVKYKGLQENIDSQHVLFSIEKTEQYTINGNETRTIFGFTIYAKNGASPLQPISVWEQHPFDIPLGCRVIEEPPVYINIVAKQSISDLQVPYNAIFGSHVFDTLESLSLHQIDFSDDNHHALITGGYRWVFVATNNATFYNSCNYHIDKIIGSGGDIEADANASCVPCHALVDATVEHNINDICLKISEPYANHYWRLVESEVSTGVVFAISLYSNPYLFENRMVLQVNYSEEFLEFQVMGFAVNISFSNVLYPSEIMEYKSLEQIPAVGFPEHVFPDETEKYNLGSEDFVWHTIYARHIVGIEDIIGQVISKLEIEDAMQSEGRLITGQRFKEGFDKYFDESREKTFIDPTGIEEPPAGQNYMTWFDIIVEE